jgi:hypothetical protein
MAFMAVSVSRKLLGLLGCLGCATFWSWLVRQGQRVLQEFTNPKTPYTVNGVRQNRKRAEPQNFGCDLWHSKIKETAPRHHLLGFVYA